jgi:hypothetical protein
MGKLQQYIDELFNTPKKALISNHDEMIFLDNNIRIRRKSIKYIIDSRKDDYYNIERIKRMFYRAADILSTPDSDFPNPTTKYPHSRIALKFYPREKETLIIVYDPHGDIKDIFNSYYRPQNKLKGLYKNKK